MKKICIFILVLMSISTAIPNDSSKVKVWWLGKSSSPIINNNTPTTKIFKLVSPNLNLNPLPVNHQWKDTALSPVVSIGPGIQTLTISLGDGSIGVFDVLTPLNITLNLIQKTLITETSSIDFCFWAPSIGFLISKPASENGAVFGLSLTPYQVRINKFSFGIGIAWINHGKVGFNKNNLSVTLPITYTIDIGQ